MESWSFDTLAEGKMGSMDWESKSPFIFGNNMRIENQGFGETCLPQLVGNSLFSPVMAATHNVVPEEHESSSGLSISVVESNSRESGVFDFITKNLSSAHVYTPSRKKRLAGRLHSPSPFCQVHGCTKSLICSKDYHKRHKVCELHSKTAKVVVNGIEQRFCQQCSRFHLLSEFDDWKRSCRKRLADHNERRRKPQVPGHSGRHGRLLPPYNSSKFKGSTRSHTMSRDIYHIKQEDQMTNDLQSMSSLTDVHLLSESRSSSNVVHQYPSVHGDNNGYTQASNYVLSPFPNEDPTGGAEDFITMNSGKTALYLLSSPPSQGSSSCQSSRNPTWCSHPLIMSNNVNPDNGVWSGDVSTIDLLQLSSQLERVELQKELFRNKCKNGASVGHSFT